MDNDVILVNWLDNDFISMNWVDDDFISMNWVDNDVILVNWVDNELRKAVSSLTFCSGELFSVTPTVVAVKLIDFSI